MLEMFPHTIRLRDHRSKVELDHVAVVGAVTRRAAAFADAGLVAGARLVIGHGEGAGFIIDLLAAWRIGAVAVAVTPSLTSDERSRVAAAIGPSLWIGVDETEGVRGLQPETPVPDGSDGSRLLPNAIELDAPALVLMTSGTTSKPKGVVHSHRSLRARIALNIAHMDRHDLERSLAPIPMHFGHGLIGNCLTPLAAGGSLTVWPDPGIGGFAQLSELIDEHRITFMSSVPTMWRIVLKASAPPSQATLRRVHVGSAPLSVDLWESIARWCGTRRVVNMYGATETANWIGGHSLEDGEAVDGLVGRPWGGMIRIRRSDGTLVATGEGDVAVSTPSMMIGYLNQPELTAETIKGEWFLTGDRGAIDADGRLRIVGRRKHEINRAGIKIPAEEIDLLLERHPGVAEACAFPLEDPIAGEVVAAAVVPAWPDAVNTADLLTWCQKRIRQEALPARIFLVDALPRTERGKIDRDHVRAAILGVGAGAGARMR